ncbi:hypothetical protein QJS10_CPA05g00174 [Acorus calamus]|uniref:Transmembrane protein n=1 Tax=Acorus calamus TaxID=4465 RepID=A0AAV9EWH3_ACOCL|nr:hypothetical protein QJS10_CPA05g00174 [Acorus calamus]
MEPTNLRERDLVVDLESCVTTSDEDVQPREAVAGVQHARKSFGSVWSGFVGIDGSVRGEDAVNNSRSNRTSSVDGNGEHRVQENVGLLEVEKPKKKNVSKKPPRPPKGPLLDAVDQKLVREMAELAMLRRARVERMKAWKKMRASRMASSSSLCSNVFAMAITVLFCVMLVLPGLCSRSSSNVSFQGSPESSIATRGQILVQYYKNIPSNNNQTSYSASPSTVEQVSGLGTNREHRKLLG